MNVISVPIASILIGPRMRVLDSSKVEELVDSIRKVGLLVPISVWIEKTSDPRTYLVAGHHRLEAIKNLGRNGIDAIVVDRKNFMECKLLEITENLHRAELTALERADHIAEWIRLTEQERKPSQHATVSPTGGRGLTGGIRAAARELGIDKDDAHRAVKVASLSEEAKETARVLGLDKNRSALLRAAQHTDPKGQIRTLKEASERYLNRPHTVHRRVNAIIENIYEWMTTNTDDIDLKEVDATHAAEWARMLSEALGAVPQIEKLRDQLLERAKEAT